MENSENKSTESFRIYRNWTRKSKKLQEKYPQLTNDDLKLEQGKENDLLERIEIRLNKNREEVIDIINNVQASKIGFKLNNIDTN